jgi:3-oxoadipate enol-lactonase
MAFVRSGEAQIYYEVHGDRSRPVVTLAHGRGGNAASWWQQVPVLSSQYCVVVFDHRCFGRSICPPEAFDREHFDNDLLAILDEEGIKKTAVVCQSMGGWTGLRTAVLHAHRVSCLVLSNTPAGVNSPKAKAALENSRRRFAEVGVSQAAVADNFRDRNPEGAYLYAQITGMNTGLPKDLSIGGRGDITQAQLSGYSVPTLMITSENDALFPPEVIREVASIIPGAQVAELPTAGHSPYFETPYAFNDTVGAFLSEHLHKLV